MIRYLERLPRHGEGVRGRGGEHFYVSRVDPDDAGGYVVTCVSPRTWARDARLVTRAARALAQEMGERAAEARHIAFAVRASVAAGTREPDEASDSTKEGAESTKL